MLEDVVLLVFCAVLAVSGLATVVWELFTGRFFDMDGLWLTLIMLTLTVVFGGNIIWSIYTGELRAILRRRKESEDRKEESEARS
jgi:ABC-type transport system involved in cytochrome c biogenesis permease component